MHKRQVFIDLLYFIVFIVASLFLAQFVAFILLLPFHNMQVASLVAKINNPLGHPEMKMQLLFVQGVTSFLAFVAAPLGFIIWKERYWRSFLSNNSRNKLSFIVYTVLIMLVSMPFVSVIISWNESIVLPSQLAGIEQWAKDKEDYLKEMTKMLTNLQTPIEFFVGLIVIALLPAIGEELVFRGYLQHKFKQLFDSPHFSIWLAAILFSAIHMQFYGFVPRVLLGAMFGYIYHYTGQFHLPVLAHFVNNGLMITMMYLRTIGVIKFDIEAEASVPFFMAMISLTGTGFLFVLIVKQIRIKLP